MAYYLNQPALDRSYGPFLSERSAWRYLFGREYTVNEVTRVRDAGWSVTTEALCTKAGR